MWTRRTLRNGVHIFVLAALLLLQPQSTAVSIALEAEAAKDAHGSITGLIGSPAE
jgi:hypothetical protein